MDDHAASRTKKRRRLATVGSVTVLVTMFSIASASMADAAVTDQILTGTAGATQVIGANGVVESGPTSASGLTITEPGRQSTNTTASAAVDGLVGVNVLGTSVTTSATATGKRIDSKSRLADVDLLGGKIHAAAVTTTSTVTAAPGVATPSGNTQFVGLTVAGQQLPVTIPKNYRVTIPGVATVTLNSTSGVQTSDATAIERASAIKVTLLSAVGSHPAGTTVLVAPTYAEATSREPLGDIVGGTGYSTKITGSAGGSVNVDSGPTARIIMPYGGTGGKTVTNSTAGVSVPGVVCTGVLANSINGSRAQEASRSTVTSKAANVNILSGLVKADAVTAQAEAVRKAGGPTTQSMQSTLVNLVVGGRAIPADAKPNTVVKIAGGLATVTINEQAKSATGATVRALDVRVTGSGLGLPVGTCIEVGVANAWVVSAG